MIGIGIKLEDVLALLDELERETLERVQAAARARATPDRDERWQRWVTHNERRLLALDAMRALALRVSPGTVLIAAAVEASS